MPSEERTLTPDDAGELLNKLMPAQTRIRQLGFMLKLPEHVVQTIYSKNMPAGERLLEILIEFLKQVEPRPTWKVIIEALKSPSVNLPVLAKALEDDSTVLNAALSPVSETSGTYYAYVLTLLYVMFLSSQKQGLLALLLWLIRK